MKHETDRQLAEEAFAGAMGALATMTVLSAALGAAAPALLPKKYTHWAAVLLFLAFGARSLYDGLSGAGGEAEKEMEEVASIIEVLSRPWP